MARQLPQIAKVPAWRRGWTRYHLFIVAAFASVLFGAILRAFLVMDEGGWETTFEVELPWSAETIWPLVSEAKGREAWQAGVSDVLLMKRSEDRVGTTYSTWYVKNGETWRASEVIMAWVPGRLFRSYSESDRDERNLTVELESLGACKTRVRVTEVTALKTFRDRYYALWEAWDESGRAERARQYLVKTAGNTLPPCKG